jgi:hypothetical protein
MLVSGYLCVCRCLNLFLSVSEYKCLSDGKGVHM